MLYTAIFIVFGKLLSVAFDILLHKRESIVLFLARKYYFRCPYVKLASIVANLSN